MSEQNEFRHHPAPPSGDFYTVSSVCCKVYVRKLTCLSKHVNLEAGFASGQWQAGLYARPQTAADAFDHDVHEGPLEPAD